MSTPTISEIAPEDLLDMPTRWSMQPVEIELLADVDLNGHPMRLGSGDPIPAALRTTPALELTAVKNFARWNPTWLETYRGAVNSLPFTLCGNTLPAEHALCLDVAIDGEPEPAAGPVSVQWQFLLVTTNSVHANPFRFGAGDKGAYRIPSTVTPIVRVTYERRCLADLGAIPL